MLELACIAKSPRGLKAKPFPTAVFWPSADCFTCKTRPRHNEHGFEESPLFPRRAQVNCSEPRLLIQHAADQGVELWSEQNRLRYRSRNGEMPASLRASLESHKPTLIATLSGPNFVRRPDDSAMIALPYQTHWWKQLAGNTADSNVTHVILELSGGLDHAVIVRSMRTVFRRHRLLSATVSANEGVPTLAFQPGVDPPLIERTCSSAEAARELASELVWTPLEEGILFRSFLIVATKTTFLVAFVLHHFVGDLRSCRTLARELIKELQTAGSAAAPAAAPLQYSDYLLALEDWMAGPALAFRLHYWREKMRRAPPVCLPADFRADPDLRAPVKSVDFSISHALRTEMAHLAAGVGGTLLTVALAGTFVTLYRTLQQSDLVVTSILAGREDPALLGLVGNTVHLLPLRESVTPDMTFTGLVAQLQDTYLRALRHQVPLKHLLEQIAETEGSAISPVVNFSAVGGIHRMQDPRLPDTDMKIRGILLDKPVEMSTVTILPTHRTQLMDSGQDIHGRVSYLSIQYRDETITDFVSTFIDSLERCTREPAGRIGKIFG